jgi:hypothetical protein
MDPIRFRNTSLNTAIFLSSLVKLNILPTPLARRIVPSTPRPRVYPRATPRSSPATPTQGAAAAALTSGATQWPGTPRAATSGTPTPRAGTLTPRAAPSGTPTTRAAPTGTTTPRAATTPKPRMWQGYGTPTLCFSANSDASAPRPAAPVGSNMKTMQDQRVCTVFFTNGLVLSGKFLIFRFLRQGFCLRILLLVKIFIFVFVIFTSYGMTRFSKQKWQHYNCIYIKTQRERGVRIG